MRPIRITYDPEGDILSITFGQPTEATGYQLSDQLLLRVNPQTQEVAGLTIRHQLLSSPPVTHFLRVVIGAKGTSARLLHPSLQEALVG